MRLVKSPLPPGFLRELEADRLEQLTVDLGIVDFSPFAAVPDVEQAPPTSSDTPTSAARRRAGEDVRVSHDLPREPNGMNRPASSNGKSANGSSTGDYPRPRVHPPEARTNGDAHPRRPGLDVAGGLVPSAFPSGGETPMTHPPASYPPLSALPASGDGSAPSMPPVPESASPLQTPVAGGSVRQSSSLPMKSAVLERIGRLANEVLQARREQHGPVANSAASPADREPPDHNGQGHDSRSASYPAISPLSPRSSHAPQMGEPPSPRQLTPALPATPADEQPHSRLPTRRAGEMNDDGLADRINAALVRQARRYGIKL